MVRKNPLIKPYLKWAGGKRQLLPEISKHIPQGIRDYAYYEPFIGAGAVLFDLQPKKAIINDSNAQLILTYRAIRDTIGELLSALSKHQEKYNEEYFYKIRSQDRQTESFQKLSDVEKAARLIFLNKTCYNGLYRVNSQGLFNVPFGKYKNPTIFEEVVLRAIHAYLKTSDIEILNGDFSQAVHKISRRSFVYFDPPYHSPDNTNFTGYQANGFDENEQIRLRDIYSELTQKKIKCLLSNSDTDFIRGLYDDNRFDVITVQAKRAINSNSAGRGEINEVLVKNWR